MKCKICNEEIIKEKMAWSSYIFLWLDYTLNYRLCYLCYHAKNRIQYEEALAEEDAKKKLFKAQIEAKTELVKQYLEGKKK